MELDVGAAADGLPKARLERTVELDSVRLRLRDWPGLVGPVIHVPDPLHTSDFVDSLAALDRLLDTLDPDAPWPGVPAEGPRGRAGTPRRVVLPEGWLDSRELSPEHAAEVAAAEQHHSGG